MVFQSICGRISFQTFSYLLKSSCKLSLFELQYLAHFLVDFLQTSCNHQEPLVSRHSLRIGLQLVLVFFDSPRDQSWQ
uniref:Uncharacterized protein n=1 Tax=uncultured marine virus TaxID=186617 RepID=A0A0F7L816_9VIRU|nr:hypothetical protein [uncultured marine virus]